MEKKFRAKINDLLFIYYLLFAEEMVLNFYIKPERMQSGEYALVICQDVIL